MERFATPEEIAAAKDSEFNRVVNARNYQGTRRVWLKPNGEEMGDCDQIQEVNEMEEADVKGGKGKDADAHKFFVDQDGFEYKMPNRQNSGV